MGSDGRWDLQAMEGMLKVHREGEREDGNGDGLETKGEDVQDASVKVEGDGNRTTESIFNWSRTGGKARPGGGERKSKAGSRFRNYMPNKCRRGQRKAWETKKGLSLKDGRGELREGRDERDDALIFALEPCRYALRQFPPHI